VISEESETLALINLVIQEWTEIGFRSLQGSLISWVEQFHKGKQQIQDSKKVLVEKAQQWRDLPKKEKCKTIGEIMKKYQQHIDDLMIQINENKTVLKKLCNALGSATDPVMALKIARTQLLENGKSTQRLEKEKEDLRANLKEQEDSAKFKLRSSEKIPDITKRFINNDQLLDRKRKDKEALKNSQTSVESPFAGLKGGSLQRPEKTRNNKKLVDKMVSKQPKLPLKRKNVKTTVRRYRWQRLKKESSRGSWSRVYRGRKNNMRSQQRWQQTGKCHKGQGVSGGLTRSFLGLHAINYDLNEPVELDLALQECEMVQQLVAFRKKLFLYFKNKARPKGQW